MQDDHLVFEEPTPTDIQFLEDRLYEFNRAATEIDNGRALGFFVRDDSDQIVAAAAGHTWGGTCELRQVWVTEARRRAGLGCRLLTAAKAEATRRGSSQLVLSTHSFQAPDFYRKLGFENVAELPDYPREHAELLLRKALA